MKISDLLGLNYVICILSSMTVVFLNDRLRILYYNNKRSEEREIPSLFIERLSCPRI